MIEVQVVDPGDQLFKHQKTQSIQIHDHAAGEIEVAAHGDLDDPVVAVAVFVVADAVDASVLLWGPSGIVQAVAGSELLDVCNLYNIGWHGSVMRWIRPTHPVCEGGGKIARWIGTSARQLVVRVPLRGVLAGYKNRTRCGTALGLSHLSGVSDF